MTDQKSEYALSDNMVCIENYTLKVSKAWFVLYKLYI